MTDAIQVVTTVASREQADAMARALVERRLAACVQVAGPIDSTYHSQGKIETAAEWTCTVKTQQSHYQAVEDAIRELHAYDVPEILAFAVVAGSRDYLEWMRGELTERTGS